MSPKYALRCTCSNAIPVQVPQAGGTVACEACGTVLEVPKLRELRKLDEIQTAETRPRGTWSGLQGALFVSGLLALVIAAGASYYTFDYRQIFEVTPPDPSAIQITDDMKDISLVDSWQLWKQFENLKIDSRPIPFHVFARTQVQRLDRWLSVFGVLAVAGIISMLASVFSRPRA